MSARTDSASPRRQRRARDTGDYPRSESLKRGLVWAAVLCSLPSAIASLWDYGKTGLRQAVSISRPEVLDLAHSSMVALDDVIRLCTPLLVLTLAAGGAAHAAERKGLNPAGSRRQWLAGFGQSTAADWLPWLSVATLGAYAWHWLRAHAADLAAVLGRPSMGRDLVGVSALHLAWIACGAWLVLGGLELILSQRAWRQRLAPNASEERHEQREMQGDPWLNALRRERHQESLNAPALAVLSEATIVVHAGDQTAVLLRYVHGTDWAPRITAVEVGTMASRVIREASSAGIPTHEDLSLTRELARCLPNSEIPETAYESVALLLSSAS